MHGLRHTKSSYSTLMTLQLSKKPRRKGSASKVAGFYSATRDRVMPPLRGLLLLRRVHPYREKWPKARIRSNSRPSHVRTFYHGFFRCLAYLPQGGRRELHASYGNQGPTRAGIAGSIRRPAVSFLDLGCGDAATLAPLLASMAVQRYKGVDLSEVVLALAAENLTGLSCPVELVCRDILAALEADSALYDVVYTSFALHHLSTEQSSFSAASRRGWRRRTAYCC